MVHCVLCVVGCVMSDTCYTKQEYPLYSGRRKKADGLYKGIVQENDDLERVPYCAGNSYDFSFGLNK